MASKFSPKKLFKGTNVYGYDDDKFSYAVSDSGYVAVRVPKDSKIHDVIAKDITFSDFNEKRTKERIVGAMKKVFSPDKELVECKRLRLALQARLDMVYLYSPVDGSRMLKGVQAHWVEALGDTIEWQVFMYGTSKNDPMLFFCEEAEVLIMPIKLEEDLSGDEIDLIEESLNSIRRAV